MKATPHSLLDISVPVHPGTPEWPGDTSYSCGWTWSVAAGDSVNVSSITMSPHVGTHADAPLHLYDGGSSAENLPLGHFAGTAYVLSVDGPPRDISYSELTSLLPEVPQRLLLHTGASVTDGEFPDDWPAPTADAVVRLREAGMILLGTDAPSVDRRTSTRLEVHHALFGSGGANLENLNLRGVADGWYELTAYPLLLTGLDAAPVRAVLRRTETPSQV